LERLRAVPGTLILYESPHRVLKLLAELVEVLPKRKVVLARELTKKFEEFKTGTAPELLAEMEKHPPRGEFVVLISGEEDEPAEPGAGENYAS
jgi:16S rRNA (cytidine1402-2'-O)-methyltransferase